MKFSNLVFFFLATLVASCGFDRSVPAAAKITCNADDQCPPDWRCQLTQGHCVQSKNYDDVSPEIIASTVRTRIVPGPDNQHPMPTALNAGSTAVVSFSTSEALARPPELMSDPPLDCVINNAEATAFEYRCKVLMGMVDFEAISVLSADMIDLAGNTRQQEVPGALIQIDTKPPDAPLTELPDHIVHVRAPWGSEASQGAALDQIQGAAGSAVGADYVLARSGGSFARGRFPVTPEWAFGPEPLAELRTGELEVASLDEAGNVSPWAQVRYGQWIVSFGKKVPGSISENPHTVGVVGAQGISPIRSDLRELGDESGLGRIDARGYTASGTATWIRAGSPLPAAIGRPILMYDSARARMVRFGGVQRHSVYTPLLPPAGGYLDVGPPLGIAETFEWAGNGWVPVVTRDPQSDGDPLGRTNAAAAYDPVARVMYLQGGQAPKTEGDAGDLTQGVVLKNTWSYNGESWTHLSDGPDRTGAVGFVDSRTGDFFVAGGINADAGFSTATSRLRVKTWSEVDGGSLSPRAFAGVASDFETNTVWMFGGITPLGTASSELLRWSNGTWTNVNAPNGPSPRSRVAAAWDSQRKRALFLGGQAQSGEILSDLWAFDGTNWTQLNWGSFGVDGGLVDQQMAYDVSHDTVVVVAREKSWVVDLQADSGWVGPIVVVSPEFQYQPPMNCAKGLKGCTLIQRVPFGALRLGQYGWTPASDMSPDASIRQDILPTDWYGHFLSTWDEKKGELIAFDEDKTWRWTADAGWFNTGVNAPVHLRGSALQSTPSGVIFINSRDGKTFSWSGTAWVAGASVPRAGVPVNGVNELNWVGMVPSQTGADVVGVQFTKRKGSVYLPACAQYDGPGFPRWESAGQARWNNGSNRPDICYIPDAVSLYSQRWTLSGATYSFTSVGSLIAASLSTGGGYSYDPVRTTTLATGGILSGSDTPTMVALEYQGTMNASPIEIGNAYGSGQPPPRISNAAAYDPTQRVHVIHGGTSDVEDWGYWQTRVVQVTSTQMDDITAKCVLQDVGRWGIDLFGPVPRVVDCVAKNVATLVPDADLNDTWLLSREKERPALLAKFDLGSSLLPLDTAIRKVSAKVVAGATGYGLSGNIQYFTQDGFRLKVWRSGRWETLGSAQAPSVAFATVNGEIASNQTLQQFSAAGPYVYITVEPLGTNGPGAAKLSVDYVEFKLDYEVNWAGAGLK